MTAVEILKKARSLIATPEAWQQGGSARDANGNRVNYRSKEACSFCLEGAVYHSYYHSYSRFEHLSKALDLLRREIRRGEIFLWNDAPERKHADVLALLDRVIECS